MINKNIDEIKNEIDKNFNKTISYEEKNYNNGNKFKFKDEVYSFKTISLKTKNDNKEFIRIIYSIIDKENKEIINNYEKFPEKLKDCLLKAAAFPTNQHLIPQNILQKWIDTENAYYISQNDHNGKINKRIAQGISKFLSEDNVFTRFIGNKVLTIETGLFKYIDNGFISIKEKIEKLNKKENIKNIQKMISNNSEICKTIINIYKFFAIYIKHTKGVKSVENKKIDHLFNELMNFNNIKNSLELTMDYFVNIEKTFLDNIFKNGYSVSFIKISKNTELNFAMGVNWVTHSSLQYNTPESHYHILLPLTPETAIIIYDKNKNINKILKDNNYFNLLMKQSLNQYLDYLNFEKGVYILISGEKNYNAYIKLMEERGKFNHLCEYTDIDLKDLSMIDLITQKIKPEIITRTQRIYTTIFNLQHSHKLEIIYKEFKNNLSLKIILLSNISNLIVELTFNDSGFEDNITVINKNNGRIIKNN